MRAVVCSSLLGELACWLVACTDHQLLGQEASHQSRVQRVVNSVRLGLEKDLPNLVPSLNVLIQTPTDNILASSVPAGSVPVLETANFRFASITKHFTATALLNMYQDELGNTFTKNLGYEKNGARIGNMAVIVYDPLTDVSVVAYLPLWDYTQGPDGDNSFAKCKRALYDAAYAARADPSN